MENSSPVIRRVYARLDIDLVMPSSARGLGLLVRSRAATALFHTRPAAAPGNLFVLPIPC